MKTILVLGVAVGLLISIVIAFRKAKDGFEDESGFHPGSPHNPAH